MSALALRPSSGVGLAAHRGALAAVVATTTAGWLLLAWWSTSPVGRWFAHDDLGSGPRSGGPSAAVLLVLIGWLVMVIAMMLPLVTKRLLDDRPAVQLAGWLVPWTMVGAAVLAGDLALHAAVDRAAVDRAALNQAAVDDLVAPALLVSVGLWQCTARTARALGACTTRLEHAPSPASWVAFARGLDLGRGHTVACGPLMVLAFAVGMHRLDLMAALTLAMAAEQVAPQPARLARAVGAALIAAGIGIGIGIMLL